MRSAGALLSLAAWCAPLDAAPQFDFIAFPALSWQQTSSAASTRSDTAASLDLFATVEGDRFRFLGEWYLTEHAKEIQRLQFGLRLGQDDTVWLGRFHTPIGYWNTAHHHGTYLQTSISRPGIEAFEGGGGVLPTHFTGLLWEGAQEHAGGTVHYALAAGLGPRLEQRLVALDVADPEHGHGSGVVVNISWRPMPFDPRQIGVFAARSRLHQHAGEDSSFEQDVVGVYANWNWSKLRMIAAAFHVGGAFDDAGGDESFGNAYLQFEHAIGARWTPYARVERSWDVDPNAPYLGRFRRFVSRRDLLGLRFELSTRQALTLEVSDFRTLASDGERVALQWSAYFP